MSAFDTPVCFLEWAADHLTRGDVICGRLFAPTMDRLDHMHRDQRSNLLDAGYLVYWVSTPRHAGPQDERRLFDPPNAAMMPKRKQPAATPRVLPDAGDARSGTALSANSMEDAK